MFESEFQIGNSDLLSDSDPAVEFEFCEPGDQVGDDEYEVKEKQ